MSGILKKAMDRINAGNGKDLVRMNGWNSERGGG